MIPFTCYRNRLAFPTNTAISNEKSDSINDNPSRVGNWNNNKKTTRTRNDNLNWREFKKIASYCFGSNGATFIECKRKRVMAAPSSPTIKFPFEDELDSDMA